MWWSAPTYVFFNKIQNLSKEKKSGWYEDRIAMCLSKYKNFMLYVAVFTKNKNIIFGNKMVAF